MLRSITEMQAQFLVSLTILLMLLPGSSAADDTCPEKCFCNKALTSVNCEGKHFRDVPEGMPVSVRKLYLGHNDFTSVAKNQFKNFPNLELLLLNNNKITEIQPFAFVGLDSLTELDLRINKIMKLDDNSLTGMKRLNTLYLTTNKIKSVNGNVFGNSTALVYVSLQANLLLAVPPLGYLPNLKRLVLQGNLISDAFFPESYRNCTMLESIVLSSNNIVNLTRTTFASLQGRPLAALYLSHNSISSVDPTTFQYFSRISSLKLGSNPLSGKALKSALQGLHGKEMASLDISGIKIDNVLLKDTFLLLKNMTITTLNMGNNKLQTLHDGTFHGLNGLLHLDISKCHIQQTESNAFAGLDKLTILNIGKNQLIDVPLNLPPALTNLYLDLNEITTIKGGAFAKLKYLQELQIRYNRITSVEQEAFLGLTSLTQLSLYDNILAVLPGKLFDQQVRLITLDLAKNNLKTIPYSPDRFASQASLVYFNLADNGCSSIQSDFFQGMSSLKYLHLEGNEFGRMIAEDYSGSLFKGRGKLTELYLNGNKISKIPDPYFQDLTSLRVLNISFNSIASWGPHLFKSAQNLQTLDLSNNLIATLSETNVHDLVALKYFNLTINPFACNCDLRWFRDWMNKSSAQLTNQKFYTCKTPKDWAGTQLLSFDRSKINCLLFAWYIIAIACASVTVIIIIIIIILYRRRWRIRLFCYKLRRGKTRRRHYLAADGRGNYGAIEDGEETFDAYISCAEQDKDWVKQHLLPGIDSGQISEEQKFGGVFKLYFDDRDSDPGNTEVGNMFEYMTLSRKVLIILSRCYMENMMNLFEWDLAVREMYNRNIDEIIIIDIDRGLPKKKIPKHLKASLVRHDALMWTEDETAQALFKQQLKDRLARKTHLAADIGSD